MVLLSYFYFFVSGGRKFMSVHHLAVLDGSVEITAGWPFPAVQIDQSSYHITVLCLLLVFSVSGPTSSTVVQWVSPPPSHLHAGWSASTDISAHKRPKAVSSVCCHWFDRVPLFLSLTLKTKSQWCAELPPQLLRKCSDGSQSFYIQNSPSPSFAVSFSHSFFHNPNHPAGWQPPNRSYWLPENTFLFKSLEG